MQFLLTFDSFSFIIAIVSLCLILLIEFSSPYFGVTNLIVNKKKLILAVEFTGALFIATVVIRVIGVIMGIRP
jgi:hypothetical protein